MDMIDWSKCNVCSPPMLSHLSDELINSNQPIVLPDFPCHSQAVERAIKDITAASSTVCGHDARHGRVLLCKKARLEVSTIDTKGSFM